MKQQDVTYKSEVTVTTAVEPAVVVTQYEVEQRRATTTPMSFVSETVREHLLSCSIMRSNTQ